MRSPSSAQAVPPHPGLSYPGKEHGLSYPGKESERTYSDRAGSERAHLRKHESEQMFRHSLESEKMYRRSAETDKLFSRTHGSDQMFKHSLDLPRKVDADKLYPRTIDLEKPPLEPSSSRLIPESLRRTSSIYPPKDDRYLKPLYLDIQGSASSYPHTPMKGGTSPHRSISPRRPSSPRSHSLLQTLDAKRDHRYLVEDRMNMAHPRPYSSSSALPSFGPYSSHVHSAAQMHGSHLSSIPPPTSHLPPIPSSLSTHHPTYRSGHAYSGHR